MQALAGLAGGDGDGPLGEDRAGIQPGIHAHDGDASLGVTGADGGLDRRGAAPARQQRGVDVDAAVGGQIQHVLAQDLPEGGNNDQVGLPACQMIKRFRCAQSPGLKDRDACRLRHPFDGRGAQFAPAPGRAVGLGDDAHDAVSGRSQQSL